MASRRKTVSSLRNAIGRQQIVRIDRKPKFADRLDGFVVLVGKRWALLAQTSDGGFFDGFVAFRIRDVRRIRLDRSFESTFAKTQAQWPPAYPFELGLDSTTDVVNGLGRGSALLGIQKEHERVAMWIGKLDEVVKGMVYLHEVRPDATWYTEPLGYKLNAITTIEVGTAYLTGLSAIAGVGPAIPSRQ